MITMERETSSSGRHPDHRHRAHEAVPRRSDAAAGGLGFDWAMTILSGAFLGGAFLDGWARTHGRVFAFTVPASLQLFYFASLLLTDGIWWSTHLWLGSIVLCGVVGWLVSHLVAPPRTWEVAREHL